jgi:hypothetical protein
LRSPLKKAVAESARLPASQQVRHPAALSISSANRAKIQARNKKEICRYYTGKFFGKGNLWFIAIN